VSIPETVDREFGGRCDPAQGMICYDLHGRFVTLTDSWQLFELSWAELAQRNFGVQAELSPGALMSVQFAFEAGDLPVDFWVDDVGFWNGVPTPAGAGGAGGGGQAGSGEAGASAEAGRAGDEPGSGGSGSGGSGSGSGEAGHGGA
jgi:hypothetical protein